MLDHETERQASARNQQHYACMEQAIEYLYANRLRQPSLNELSQYLGFSPTHLQRMFVQWAGISPKRFLQVLTTQHAKELLAQQQDSLHVTYELGLSSPSRLHDLLISCEALSPAQIRSQGRGLEIEYGHVQTPFGRALIGWTARGICYLSFGETDVVKQETILISDVPSLPLQLFLPAAKFIEKPEQAQTLADRLFVVRTSEKHEPERVHLLLKGTNFQVKVWEALIRLADQPLVSYQQLAAKMGQPQATRAVASAVARNNIAWLIPCHRVIRQHGEFGEYRWGSARKRAMLAVEMAQITEKNAPA